MLSIRSGGIWPRRTPACGGLRGTTAFAYGGSQRATAPARNRPGAPGLSGEKRTHRSFSGKIWTLRTLRGGSDKKLDTHRCPD